MRAQVAATHLTLWLVVTLTAEAVVVQSIAYRYQTTSFAC